ncbi:protein dehydratase [Pseudaminobacter arsenicus]|uniref:Protein dehydratase n=1 Tax=Borborobacter arsenicus TaxID=1851146 RepID=A0A432VCL0_9HYPH|nr:MaoC family dehydratase N-terminal domain-containing protein [Pseudaminobacter arsenicus]RUM99901.1 protein dehydratase [Pseudaminobacter arsenicus]
MVDTDYLRQWIGRKERICETITPNLVERFEATLGSSAHRMPDAAPLAIHWCLAPPAVPSDELGSDGHPARGGFLPPVPLPRRMWAGGKMAFHHPLRAGAEVTRASRIADVTHKTGRSGELVFVTVEHSIESDGKTAITERQDIVYRNMEEAAKGPAPSRRLDASAPKPAQTADHTETVEATTTLLFRYSALTFNGHRIHYDLDYARDVEGYPGLVVHGPLQATLMLHMAARLHEGQQPREVSYRGVSPLFHGAAFTVNANRTANGIDLWCADRQGIATMNASIQF